MTPIFFAICLLLKAVDNRFCDKLLGTVKIKEKSPHVKDMAMPAGRYLTGRDMVSAMISIFPRQSVANKLKLDKTQAVLFDLDGTLIDVDMKRFVPDYLRLLVKNMGGRVNAKHATQLLHQAVAAMFANLDASSTLEMILLEMLQDELGMSPEDFQASLERFFNHDLASLRFMVSVHPLARQLIDTCQTRGWQLVLATNPIFPRKVIDARLAWAGLGDCVFHHVTDYETAHFCKPSPMYFAEILEQLQLRAEACLMIGNDSLHDMAAGQVGMQTCLLTPWRIRRSGLQYKADWQGAHDELLEMIQSKSSAIAPD
jgi:FMN phosphatase YigB (HAD superfamily)